MRRLLVFLVLLPAFLVGCGDDSGDKAGSALEEGLSYLPKNAPFVVAIDTDLNGSQYKALDKIVRKFPFGEQAIDSLQNELQQGDTDFNEVRPLLGNPFVVGATDAKSFVADGDTDNFVGAVQAKDGDKLQDLVDKENPKEVGDKEGAKVYQDDDGDRFAIKDDVLIVAGTEALLDQALQRRAGDDHLSQDDFDDALSDLPEEALVRGFFDVGQLIEADPDTQQARKVKWVAGLRKLGLTAQAREDAITISFNQHTEGVSEEDLPIASGDESPEVVQHPTELNFGIRDPSQIVEFGLATGTAIEGGQVEAGKRQLEQQLGIDLEKDVLDQLTSDVSINVDPRGNFGARAELKDPAAFKRTLDKVAEDLPQLSGEGGSVRRDGDFYLVPADGQTLRVGVSGDVLVVSNEASRARELGGESPSAVSGAKGAVVMTADAEKIVDAVLEQLGPQLGIGGQLGGQLFTGPLGKLTGSITSSTDSLKGEIRLGID